MTAPPDDLAPLVVRLQAGDRAAFETLFRSLHGALVRYAGTIDPDEAQDAVQDAFLTLWRRRETLDPERSVKALLYASVRNKLFNRTRDAARRDELHETLAAPAMPTPPDDELDATILGDRLRGWLAALPERQREAFRLSRFDGLSYAEVADVMACSTKTVENHIGRALATLRDRIRQTAPDALQP